jgi:hypothetical protein
MVIINGVTDEKISICRGGWMGIAFERLLNNDATIRTERMISD